MVAWRKPRNPLGWLLLGGAVFLALSQDASFYTVADYRLRHGDLPLGWVAVLAQPGWALGIVLSGLAILLFPDGQPPSPRWRWVLWVYLAVAMLYLAGAGVVTVGAIIGHDIRVDSSGNLVMLSHPTGSAAWWGAAEAVFLPVLAACWLGSVVAQVASYALVRRAPEGAKWLLSGSAIAGIGIPLTTWLSGMHGILGVAGGIVGAATLLALPVCIGVAILKYRLFDIDRIVSRTLAYTIVTGLLVGLTQDWCCWRRGSYLSPRQWRSQRPHWRPRRCSTRCGTGSSGTWTAGSTGPDMTRIRWSPPLRPGCRER